MWTVQVLCENNPKIQINFRNSGVLEPLIALLSSKNTMLRERACNCILGMTLDNYKNQQAVRTEMNNTFVPLLNLLDDDAHLAIIEAGMKALTAIAVKNPRNQELILKEDGILRLIKIIKNEEQPRLQEESANTIAAVCVDNKQCQDGFREAGGLPYLVPLLCTRIVSLQLAATKAIAVLCKVEMIDDRLDYRL